MTLNRTWNIKMNAKTFERFLAELERLEKGDGIYHLADVQYEPGEELITCGTQSYVVISEWLGYPYLMPFELTGLFAPSSGQLFTAEQRVRLMKKVRAMSAERKAEMTNKIKEIV